MLPSDIRTSSQIHSHGTHVAGIAAVCARVPELVTRFVAQDASADEISRVVTAVADAVTRKLIALAEADLGPAPVPYCWLVLGSQARHEYGLELARLALWLGQAGRSMGTLAMYAP